MDRRLTRLINQFIGQGLSLSLALSPNQLLIQFPGFPDYGATATLGAGSVVSVTIWETFAGTTIGEFWTANSKDLIPLTLLKIVSYDSALATLNYD